MTPLQLYPIPLQVWPISLFHTGFSILPFFNFCYITSLSLLELDWALNSTSI